MANAITDLRELTVAAGQANKVLDDLERQALEVGVSTQKLGKLFKDVRGEANNLADAGNRLGLSQQALTKYNRDGAAAFMANYNALIQSERATRSLQGSNNKLGVAFNQASFQVNDFFVQIGSGQDALVAFGQQGSQMAQILTMFGGSLGVIGASVSVLIPLTTSLLRSIDLFGPSAEQSLKRAEAAADKLIEKMKAVGNSQGLLTDVSGYDNLSAAIQRLATQDLAVLNKELDKVTSKSFLTKLGENLAVGLSAGGASYRLGVQINEEEEARVRLNEGLNKLLSGNVTTLGQVEELQRMIVRAQGEGATLTEKQLATLDKLSSNLSGIAVKAREYGEEQSKNFLSSADLLEAELQFGKDSSQVRELRNQQEREALKLKLESNLVAEREAKQALWSLEISQDLTRQLEEKAKAEERAKEAKKAATEEVRRQKTLLAEQLTLELQILGTQEGVRDSIIQKEVERYRIQKGISAEVEKQSELEQNLLRLKGQAIGAALDKQAAGKKSKESPFEKEFKAGQQALELAIAKRNYEAESFDFFSRQLDLKYEDNKLSEQQKRHLWEQKKLAEDINEILRQREEIQKALFTSASNLGTTLGEAFAEGKEPDFGKMLKELISLFLKVQIAVGGFEAALLAMKVPPDIAGELAGVLAKSSLGFLDAFAKGGVIDGGVQKFADGGVVSSPTLFNMSGNRMGLMGEAGPEAILPLRRGRDGKLGVAANDNQGIQVTQVFNFSANGDESVKKIIAEEAPKLSRMASFNMANDLRRRRA